MYTNKCWYKNKLITVEMIFLCGIWYFQTDYIRNTLVYKECIFDKPLVKIVGAAHRIAFSVRQTRHVPRVR